MKSGQATAEAFLTKGDLMEYLKISLPTVNRLMRNREIPYVKIGKKVLFRKIDIDRFVDRHLVK